ncbi:aldehyde dehydrogenase (NADP(+)) [Herbaspirillum sp. WKF16]|uniref:aldehyde dehydrogenase (NADP(+)) n=1 Tax=Herbaspirillum sp. WKF16 TaxID=3028312 RepID=UPI0023A9BDCA|nr:aldehyde dehydrogenase (NADP(+)) [Herbaspirillum sp. WKF16]WDZ96358.1 aldehyde dehydrogenase (NADP(+)) [Herbaspirillum sp. WKF16]
MSFKILGHNYIGGQRSGEGDVQLHSVDAATGALFETPFLTATDKEVAAAVHAAEKAYPAYRATTSEQRAAFLEAVADEIDALGDDFIAQVARETALPAAPRLTGERARTSGQMRLFAKVLRRGDFYGARIDTALPERKPLPRPDVRQYKIGVGPVAVFGASNFPLAFSVAGGDTAAALAAGCPVVFKAHTGHLVTSELVADAIERAVKKTGMPAGTFNMVYGDRVGAQLVKSAGIQAVGFTGSLRGGRALCDMAAARPQPIPVFAEMSSINPIILMPEALKVRGEAIAKDLAGSVTVGVGQLCTSPGLLMGVKSPELTAFIEKLSAAFGGANPATMLNSGGLSHYNSGVARLTQLPGVKVISTGGSSYTQAVPHLFQADASLLFSKEAPLEEEVFGPSTVIVELESREQLLDFAANMHGQLTATLQAEIGDLQGNEDLIAILEQKAGRLLLNGYPTGVEVCDAMVHGGPYPATSDARGTSVGTLAIERFLRPVCYQNYPDSMLPAPLKNANPLGLLRLVDGEQTRAVVG